MYAYMYACVYMFIHIFTGIYIHVHTHTDACMHARMPACNVRWQQCVDFLDCQVSFAKEHYICRNLLQKRPVNVGSLLRRRITDLVERGDRKKGRDISRETRRQRQDDREGARHGVAC